MWRVNYIKVSQVDSQLSYHTRPLMHLLNGSVLNCMKTRIGDAVGKLVVNGTVT